MIAEPVAVMAVLAGIAALFFWLEKRTEWRLFQYFPPLLFIYATPVVLSNTGVLPSESAAYDGLKQYGLPVFLTLMLLSVDVRGAVRVMGRGVLVMLMGTLGVVVGGALSYAVVSGWLGPDAWKGYGALAGSWIGGTGNMMAVAGGIGTGPEELGLAVLADNLVYVVWLPVLLGSKSFADRFNRWARVPPSRIQRMEEAAEATTAVKERPEMRHLLYLATLALGVTWVAQQTAPLLPELEPVLSTGTWKVLLITTLGIALSFTPAKAIPGSQPIAMAIVYVFVAGMGARASLAGLDQAPAFVAGAFLWIAIHGAFLLLGAWLLRVDVHSVAIASAANIGGAASAPVVAGYHRESLVPVSILMALIGYAIGNYAAILTAQLCFWAGGGG